MEESLYFKPEPSGKKKTQEKDKKNHRLLKLFFFLLFLIFLILTIIWLLRGNTTSSNERIPSVKNTAVSCLSESFVYPFFSYDGAKSRKTSVKMVFSEEELKSITFEYSLFYDSSDTIVGSEAHNRADMNISFSQNGLGPDSYDAKYTMLSDRMRMNLYAISAELDETAKPYFLVKSENSFPTSAEELIKNYTSQGFSCETLE